MKADSWNSVPRSKLSFIKCTYAHLKTQITSFLFTFYSHVLGIF